ncbi:hypothetical protein QJS10_CPB17g01750 [Acorus calamus]|uniref:Pentatricopeptide repeat-containing protein n=1 Tax=Acorus calamus TaxID=4465 RepID=A0AAV9CTC5_ACOCL|nr:hypothetical protein QJS10_CPB17g01750 [Acorus calamus]
MPDKAPRLFHRLRSSFDCPNSPSVASLNALLHALVENGRFSAAESLLGEASSLGVHPNSVSYNIILKGACLNQGWRGAMRVFDEMLQRKVSPSVVTYNTLIGFLCKSGDLEKAMEVKRAMGRGCQTR